LTVIMRLSAVAQNGPDDGSSVPDQDKGTFHVADERQHGG